MLVNFRVENFKSFKDMTEFSMEATKLRNLRESNTFDVNNISLLKSAVIYGANASGKSNLLKALHKMQEIVKLSTELNFMQSSDLQPFLLNSQQEKEPTLFEIEFIIDEVLYRYGFKVNSKRIIHSEWLYQKKLMARAQEVLVFIREKQNIKLTNHFKEGKKLEDKTRSDTLFLTVATKFDGYLSTRILNWFAELSILSNIKNEGFQLSPYVSLEQSELKDKVITFIKNADVSISDLDIKKIKKEESEEVIETIVTKHIKYDKNNNFESFTTFDLEFESDGTQKLLALAGFIIVVLEHGSILIIDELDNSFHTELVEAIVKLFNSKETNPNNAQLIFTTHDTNLLNQKHFRRDQIWFTEKDIYGATELYSLIDYGKGTRNDLALEKSYLYGKFGAVPHIINLSYKE
jgi:AAA15 family ATPase/GTPase